MVIDKAFVILFLISLRYLFIVVSIVFYFIFFSFLLSGSFSDLDGDKSLGVFVSCVKKVLSCVMKKKKCDKFSAN